MKQFTIAIFALALGACATSNTPSNSSTAAQKPMEEKEYRVGSRIPVRDPSTTSSSPTSVAAPSVLAPGMPARVQ
jgi:outer membrane lipoprotein SlyB